MFGLVSVFIETLPEVSLSMEKCHGNHRDFHVRRRPECIAGQNAEAATVGGHVVGKCNFHGEIRDSDRAGGLNAAQSFLRFGRWRVSPLRTRRRRRAVAALKSCTCILCITRESVSLNDHRTMQSCRCLCSVLRFKIVQSVEQPSDVLILPDLILVLHASAMRSSSAGDSVEFARGNNVCSSSWMWWRKISTNRVTQ